MTEDKEKNMPETDTPVQEEAETAAGENKKEKKKQDDLRHCKAALADAEKKLAGTEAKLADAEDKYVRLFAEYDNFRKRAAKEKESIYSDAVSDALSAILPILDNLERAAMYTDADKVAEGVQMILKSFSGTMEKLGVTEMDCAGGTFDPMLHNAVMHIEDDEHGEGEIVEVLQKGYMRGEKIIRHAMVKVAN